MIFIDDNELVGVFVNNLPGKLSVITSNDKAFARFSPVTGDGLVSYECPLEELVFCDMAVQLKNRSRAQVDFIRRFSCGFCGGDLFSPECGAIYDKCSEGLRILRFGRTLKEFHSRRRLKNVEA